MKFQVRAKAIYEAVQFFDTPESLEELAHFLPSPLLVDYQDPEKLVLVLPVFLYEAEIAQVGDWVLKNGENNYCAVEPDLFAEYYEPVKET